jgi:biotin carboxylase
MDAKLMNEPKARNRQTPTVVVDGYSTGRALVEELRLHGADCIHVASTGAPPALLAKSFDPSPYRRSLGYIGGPAEAARKLSEIGPVAVTPGSEPGVDYAEALATTLALPTNCMERKGARRDKFMMIERLHEAGLHAASQAMVTSKADALAWCDAHGAFPVVVKPLSSAGSDGVTICESREEVEWAFERAFGAANLFGEINRAVLVQSFLDGPQFMVNTVSADGEHKVTDAWRFNCRRVDGYSIAMEDWELLDPEEKTARALIAYTRKALDAIGIRNGAAHSELMLTPNGPALIETGARLMGAAMDRAPYLEAGLEGTQATFLARYLLDREHDFDAASYRHRRAFAKVFFLFDGPGTVADVSGLERLEDLRSFIAHYRPLKPGDAVRKTTDTTGLGGAVYLVHDDPEQVRRDKQAIREMEAEGLLYRVTVH